ncbi:MAG: RNA polymerase sigma factor [Longimicrobiales bacterium]|nr:RNA polymerase sigma factor [Longimicrobiales bacterium]
MNEAELIDPAGRGDMRASRILYDRHVDRVFHLAYRMAGEEDLARDITQEAFFRAFSRLDQFRGKAAFSTWLHRVTASVALNEFRRRDRHRKRERDLATVGQLPGPPASVSDPLLRERVRAAVDALPEIYRTVFILHDVEGYDHGEIAHVLEVATGTSKARLSRARTKLRAALGDLAPEFA